MNGPWNALGLVLASALGLTLAGCGGAIARPSSGGPAEPKATANEAELYGYSTPAVTSAASGDYVAGYDRPGEDAAATRRLALPRVETGAAEPQVGTVPEPTPLAEEETTEAETAPSDAESQAAPSDVEPQAAPSAAEPAGPGRGDVTHSSASSDATVDSQSTGTYFALGLGAWPYHEETFSGIEIRSVLAGGIHSGGHFRVLEGFHLGYNVGFRAGMGVIRSNSSVELDSIAVFSGELTVVPSYVLGDAHRFSMGLGLAFGGYIYRLPGLGMPLESVNEGAGLALSVAYTYVRQGVDPFFRVATHTGRDVGRLYVELGVEI